MYDPASYYSVTPDIVYPCDFPTGYDHGPAKGIFGNRVGSDPGDEVEQDYPEASVGLFNMHGWYMDYYLNQYHQPAINIPGLRPELLNPKSYY